MSNVRDQVGAECYARLEQVIRAAFPGAADATNLEPQVDALVHQLWSRWEPSMQKSLGLPPPPAPTTLAAPRAAMAAAPLSASADPATYYVAEATHRRATAAPNEAFVGHLPVVRVNAPKSGTATIHTRGGDVLSGDHLVYSVEDVNAKFASTLGYSAERVDLVTPPRLLGARFGAVAAFVGYREANGPPSFYLLEAGMATGEPKVIFFGRTMDTTIVDWSSYTPTPFSAPDHRYEGKLAVSNAGEPIALCVKAFRKNASGQFEPSPYVQIDVDYQKQSGPSDLLPAFITAQAALRVAAIAEAIGMDPFSPFTDVMAALGMQLPWVAKPVHP